MNDASRQRYRIGSGSLDLIIGDITNETTDAIVNAANSSLLGGGGVDGAIHRAAGPLLLSECKKIRAQYGPLPPGRAVATSGANLKAKHVIHTVGPVWQDGSNGEPETLASCYRESMKLAEQLSCLSVSFPSISTGAFGYPVHGAARTALATVVEHLRTSSVKTVRFVLFDIRTHRAYSTEARKLAKTIHGFQFEDDAVGS
jgi:O-acetyl-ADP-ribose deacetylase